MNCRTNAIVLDGVRAGEVEEGLQPGIDEELGQRLEQLDARPPGSAAFVACIVEYPTIH
jgi:bacterioferritin